jgi:hypothetical protein
MRRHRRDILLHAAAFLAVAPTLLSFFLPVVTPLAARLLPLSACLLPVVTPLAACLLSIVTALAARLLPLSACLLSIVTALAARFLADIPFLLAIVAAFLAVFRSCGLRDDEGMVGQRALRGCHRRERQDQSIRGKGRKHKAFQGSHVISPIQQTA